MVIEALSGGVVRVRTLLLNDDKGGSCLELETSMAESERKSAGKRLEGVYGRTSWVLAEDVDVTSNGVTPSIRSCGVELG